jgi:hypothetical protein
VARGGRLVDDDILDSGIRRILRATTHVRAKSRATVPCIHANKSAENGALVRAASSDYARIQTYTG